MHPNKKNKDLYDIYLLANEENNSQIVNEVLEGYKKLIDEKEKRGEDTKILNDRLIKLQSEFWVIRYEAREKKKKEKKNGRR